jgi:hypothetical protein
MGCILKFLKNMTLLRSTILHRSIGILVGGVIFAGGCEDPTAKASLDTVQDSAFTVYAVNGTPQNAPNAMEVRFARVTSVTPAFGFDLAFDITSTGDVKIYTVRALASQLVSVHRVGLQATTTPFDQITEAPTKNFAYDSIMVVPLGRTVLVEVAERNCLGALRGSLIHSKFRVDSINVVKRALFLRILSNPNCGFVQLTPGTPSE